MIKSSNPVHIIVWLAAICGLLAGSAEPQNNSFLEPLTAKTSRCSI